MKFARLVLSMIVLAVLGAPAASADDPVASAHHAIASPHEQLGSVDFPVSCAPQVQAQFNRAVAMLHSFWFAPALKTFGEVLQADPSCAMAYWGIAMTERESANPLIGPPGDAALKRGFEALEKAKASDPKTQRERDYIGALELYYKDYDTVDYSTRIVAYAKGMKRVYDSNPNDLEAAVFYALALLEAADPDDITLARQREAASILEKVYAQHPDHPGAPHYVIHADDYPALATNGLTAARSYGSIAPAAPHALHMPSHIFSLLGMWDESIKSNEEALRVAPSYVHATDFMVCAYLQMAQDHEAKRLVGETAGLLKTQAPTAQLTPTGGVLAVYTAFAAIPARYAIERGEWSEAAMLQPIQINPVADAITYFARAMGAVRNGDIDGAQKDIEQLQSLKETLTKTKQSYWAGQVEIYRRAAAAWVGYREGKKDEALVAMRSAATLDDDSGRNVAMENPIWPMRELLAEMLLEMNEPGPALREFEASLKKWPHRFRGYYGAAKAADRLGEKEKARTYYGKLVELCRQADVERPELSEAKAFLRKNGA